MPTKPVMGPPIDSAPDIPILPDGFADDGTARGDSPLRENQ